MPIPRRWSSYSQAKGDWRLDPAGQWVIWADVREVIEWAAQRMTPRDPDPLTVDEEVAAVIDGWHPRPPAPDLELIDTNGAGGGPSLVGLLLAALSGALVMAVIFWLLP